MNWILGPGVGVADEEVGEELGVGVAVDSVGVEGDGDCDVIEGRTNVTSNPIAATPANGKTNSRVFRRLRNC